jgi:hypothetical protein
VKSVTYVEIDLPYCSLTYGTSPCTASVGVTGDIKCYNSLKTCQDIENFANAPVTLRFAMSADYLPRDIEAIPSIQSVSISPGTISLGKNLGERASVTVNFRDHPWSDTGVGGDKYLADRAYDPFRRGTFWGKFRARQPFVRGRPFRLIRGYVGQTLAEMETRHYVIDSFDGPRPDGTFSLIAKDVLKLASSDRAKAPRMSNGRLVADISNSATSLTLTPSGIGNLEYPTAGYLNLSGKEIVQFTRSGDVVTISGVANTGRGKFNTTAVAHTAGARAQVCLYYSGVDPADILADLLENYADVDPAYIPLVAWQEATAAYLGNVYTALIAEPTGVEELASEIIEQGGLVFGWDDISTVIRLDVLRNIATNAALFSDANVLPNSLRTREQPDARLSQVEIYFGQRNPLEPLDNPDNYECTEVVAALQSAGNYGSSAIKTIYSRWIPFAGRALATRLGNILVGRFQDPPRRVNFNVFRQGVGITPALMGGYQFEYPGAQDVTGLRAPVPVQITRLNPTNTHFECEAEEVLFTGIDPIDITDRVLLFDTNQTNIDVLAQHNSIYPPLTDADVTNGVNLTVIVAEGVTIGSAVATAAGVALNFGLAGSWPSGFPITLRVAGKVRGKGGKGGNAVASGTAQAGEAGGTALYTRHPLTIELMVTGDIKGGGGGGGGGGWGINPFGSSRGGGGGGGGAGVGPGLGGSHVVGAPGGNGTEDSGASGGVPGYIGGNGGRGGGPGAAGTAGNSGSGTSSNGAPGAGGAQGRAIDGISYCTFAINDGVRAGLEVN